MGRKKLIWTWVLLLVFCIGAILTGMKYFSIEGHVEPMWEVESPGEIKEIISEGSYPCMLTPWSEQKPCEQYRYADWNGNTYVSSKKQIQTKEIGEYLGSLYAYGHESLNSLTQKKNIWYIRHEKKAELYQIRGISERFAVAVHLEGEQKYYVYAREDYAPETLGDLVEDLNLREYLKISKEFECGNNLEEYTGDVTDAFWDMILSHMEAKSVRKPHHSFLVLDEEVGSSIFETGVAYKLTGWKHVLLYVSEHGYIGINQPLLNPECIFKVGEDAVEEFMEYIDHLFCGGQTEFGQGNGNVGDASGCETSCLETKPYQQYLYADWDGGTYFTSRTPIGEEKLGQHLCDLSVYSFENEATTNGVRYQKNAGIYQIDKISERFAVAVRLEGDEKYYVYTREDYFPETLGDFIEDLNLAEYLEIDTYFECGDELEKAYTGEIETMFWDTFLSQKEIKCQKIPHHDNKVWNPDLGFTVFETHVSYTLTGWENKLFYMTEQGGIGTRILGWEYVFVLGEDVAEDFLEYISENCKNTEMKDNLN